MSFLLSSTPGRGSAVIQANVKSIGVFDSFESCLSMLTRHWLTNCTDNYIINHIKIGLKIGNIDRYVLGYGIYNCARLVKLYVTLPNNFKLRNNVRIKPVILKDTNGFYAYYCNLT